MSEERGRTCGLDVGIQGASNAHSASLRSLGYTGTALQEMPYRRWPPNAAEHTFRIGDLLLAFEQLSPIGQGPQGISSYRSSQKLNTRLLKHLMRACFAKT